MFSKNRQVLLLIIIIISFVGILLIRKNHKNVKDVNGVNDMKKLPNTTPEPKNHTLQSLILSNWRSGSSFFGQILNAIPGSYYNFEPLMYFGTMKIRDPFNSNEALDTIRNLFKCNYTALHWLNETFKDKDFITSQNTALWESCRSNVSLCYNADYLNGFCRMFSYQAMKVVRLRAAFAEPLLTDPQLNVKIVLLIRDPRGTMQSRKREHWCYHYEDCENSKHLCDDMVADFKAAEVFTKKYPQQFKVIRYEELSMHPYKMTDEILKFYGLPFHENVTQFLDSHTRTDDGDGFSVFRNSKKAPFHWIHELNFTEIQQIQSNCAEAMSLWGYRNVINKHESNGNDFNPLLTFPFAIENKEESIDLEKDT